MIALFNACYENLACLRRVPPGLGFWCEFIVKFINWFLSINQ